MTNETHCLSAVMPGFMPGIHVLTATPKTWMAGTSPAMTNETHCLFAVMPGFMPGIHVLTATPKTWMAGTTRP